MGRTARICVHIDDALYYVTSQGEGNNSEIFKDDEDYRTYEGLLRKYKEQYDFRLFSYLLLPNHLHLLIELKEGITISQIMHALNSSYIKYFNRRYNRKGHLLQERFKLVVVEKKPNLLPLTAYIHLHPCRKGLVKAPKDYAYSSYGNYTDDTPQIPGISIKDEAGEVMGLLAQTTDCRKYEDFVTNIPEEDKKILGKNLQKTRILGSEGFKERVKEQVEIYTKQQEAAQNPEPDKKLVLAGSLAVFVFGIMAVFLYMSNLGLKDEYQTTLQVKERESRESIKEAKKKLKQDLTERYAADMVSYQAMAKRSEIEKKRIAELEAKIR